LIKTNSGYCAKKMHVFINFISYSSNSCHKSTETTTDLHYHYPILFSGESDYCSSNACHWMYFTMCS